MAATGRHRVIAQTSSAIMQCTLTQGRGRPFHSPTLLYMHSCEVFSPLHSADTTAQQGTIPTGATRPQCLTGFKHVHSRLRSQSPVSFMPCWYSSILLSNVASFAAMILRASSPALAAFPIATAGHGVRHGMTAWHHGMALWYDTHWQWQPKIATLGADASLPVNKSTG